MVNNYLNQNDNIDSKFFNKQETEGLYVLGYSINEKGHYVINTVEIDEFGNEDYDSFELFRTKNNYKNIMIEIEDTILKVIEINNPTLYNKIQDCELELEVQKFSKKINTAIIAFDLLGGALVGYSSAKLNTTYNNFYELPLIIGAILGVLGGLRVLDRDKIVLQINELFNQRYELINEETKKLIRKRK